MGGFNSQSDSLLVYLSSAKFLGDRGDVNMLLLKAVLEGKRDDVEEFLKRGADVNRGPMFSPLHSTVQKNHKEVVTLLLERGSKIDAQLSPCPPNEPCPTVLIYAVHGGHADLVAYPLEKGADPHRKSRGIFLTEIEYLPGDTFAINMTAKYEEARRQRWVGQRIQR
jgi:ankyrin repeat protein